MSHILENIVAGEDIDEGELVYRDPAGLAVLKKSGSLICKLCGEDAILRDFIWTEDSARPEYSHPKEFWVAVRRMSKCKYYQPPGTERPSHPCRTAAFGTPQEAVSAWERDHHG